MRHTSTHVVLERNQKTISTTAATGAFQGYSTYPRAISQRQYIRHATTRQGANAHLKSWTPLIRISADLGNHS